MLMAAAGKLFGTEMSVELFNNLDLFGLPDLSRLTIGMAQLLLVVLLFKKETERPAALLIAINMIGAFILVAVHAQAVVVLILALAIYLKGCKSCKKGTCSTCPTSSGTCDSKKEESTEEEA